jgi:cytochrome c556
MLFAKHVKAVSVGFAILAVATSLSVLCAEPASPRAEKRARPPQWPPEMLDLFFDDARKQLVGERPNYSQPAVASESNSPTPGNAAEPTAHPEWSKLIDSETIEAEIKRLSQSAAASVATPSDFKGGNYKDCRQSFSLLAVLFAISAEYDSARWYDAAPAMRDLFARAGYNCKVGTDHTYREAIERSQELSELIGGSRPQLPTSERLANWGQVADRPPLMQRLERAHQERLTKWLANERLFDQHQNDLIHEAQLVAALAEVIGREGFEYWDDEQYAEYARNLRNAASDIAAAAEQKDFQSAQKSMSRVTNACNNCHEGYRG